MERRAINKALREKLLNMSMEELMTYGRTLIAQHKLKRINRQEHLPKPIISIKSSS